MDGFMLAVSANSAPRGKQQWQTVFLKADEISAKLIAFLDRSQSQIRWSLGLTGADISTPVPGEPNFGIDIDDTPYCFYVRETNATSDCVVFFSASDDATKKRWMKSLLQIARDGPKAPRFAATQAENEFAFHARVVKFRPHEQGTHAVDSRNGFTALMSTSSANSRRLAGLRVGVHGLLLVPSLQQNGEPAAVEAVGGLAPVR